MHRHQLQIVRRGGFFPVAIQCHDLQIFVQTAVRIVFTEFFNIVHQFLQVFDTFMFTGVFQHPFIAAFRQDRFKEFIDLHRVFHGNGAPFLHHGGKPLQRCSYLTGEQLVLLQHFIHRYFLLTGTVGNHVHRLIADAAARYVDHSLQSQIVGTDCHAQITERVFDFLALIEPDAAVDDIGNAGVQHRFFQ